MPALIFHLIWIYYLLNDLLYPRVRRHQNALQIIPESCCKLEKDVEQSDLVKVINFFCYGGDNKMIN